MTRTLYTVVLRLLAPVVWLALAIKSWRTGARWEVLSGERFGLGVARRVRGVDHDLTDRRPTDRRPTDRRLIWVHAVSVGETRAAAPLIRALIARGDHVLLTHMTPTGRQMGASLYAQEIADGSLVQAWMPYDFPGAWRRFLASWRPCLAVLIEREVWPNMMAQCRAAKVPVALVSARLSDSGLKRAARLGAVLRQAYSSIDVVCAQSEADAARLTAAGVKAVQVCGNLKFDVVLDADQWAQGRAWRAALGRPVLMLGSTREGEDVLFARELAAARPSDVLVVWVPRHPQRFDEVARDVATAGLSLRRRSATSFADIPPDVEVFLGDSMGEMAFYYGACDAAIIGGSFAPLGGQNFIEACAAGAPVILGPDMHNFQEAARDALAAGVAVQVADVAQAVSTGVAWARAGREGVAESAAGALWLARHVGATARTVAALPR